MKKPLRAYIDADSITISCPCGDSITGEGEKIREFKKLHRKHSNGKIKETITADGGAVENGKRTKTFKI